MAAICTKKYFFLAMSSMHICRPLLGWLDGDCISQPKFSFLSFLHLKLLMTFMYRESCSICAMCAENILYISTAVCAGGRVVNLETALKGQRDVQHPAHHINNNLDLHCKRKNNSHMSRK